jgi:transcriptional regulator with XRE-family HTH domain
MQVLRDTSHDVTDLTALYPPRMLADWVKKTRAERDWTQQELADKAGLDRVEINAIENGRNKGSSHRVRDGLARAFGVPLATVAAEAGDQKAATTDAEVSVEYERNPKLARMALGQHREWERAKEEAVARFGRFIDSAVLEETAEMVLSNMPEHLTAEIVMAFHDALAKAKGLK